MRQPTHQDAAHTPTSSEKKRLVFPNAFLTFCDFEPTNEANWRRRSASETLLGQKTTVTVSFEMSDLVPQYRRVESIELSFLRKEKKGETENSSSSYKTYYLYLHTADEQTQSMFHFTTQPASSRREATYVGKATRWNTYDTLATQITV